MTDLEHLEQLQRLGSTGQWAYGRIIELTLEKIRLEGELAQSRAMVGRLEQQLEQWQRQAHRQAAPFRRTEKERNPNPGRPGRKGGHQGHYRSRPAVIDQEIHVQLHSCPHCGAGVCDKRQLTQYIEEIPVVRPTVTRLTTEEAWCVHCQQSVYSTHPLQTSRADGAAAVLLGPRALALACDLNKARGLSMRQTVSILGQHFGLKLTAGALAKLVQRVGRKLQQRYDAMAVDLRASPVVHADETSWWVGEPGWWLWVFATPKLTYYVVIKSRAAAVVANLLGPDFAGVLVSDCLSIYDDVNPHQQKCYSHHLKAISQALETYGESNDYLLQCQALLRTALLLKALQAPNPDENLTLCVRTLQDRADALLKAPRDSVIEEKVRTRLSKQHDHLFTFLERTEVPATNNLAERQLRPAVIARKISCGNKTSKGATAWVILASLAATCRQTGASLVDSLCQQLVLHPVRAP